MIRARIFSSAKTRPWSRYNSWRATGFTHAFQAYTALWAGTETSPAGFHPAACRIWSSASEIEYPAQPARRAVGTHQPTLGGRTCNRRRPLSRPISACCRGPSVGRCTSSVLQPAHVKADTRSGPPLSAMWILTRSFQRLAHAELPSPLTNSLRPLVTRLRVFNSLRGVSRRKAPSARALPRVEPVLFASRFSQSQALETMQAVVSALSRTPDMSITAALSMHGMCLHVNSLDASLPGPRNSEGDRLKHRFLNL